MEFRLSAPFKHARSFNDLRLVFRLIDLNGDEKRKPDGFFLLVMMNCVYHVSISVSKRAICVNEYCFSTIHSAFIYFGQSIETFLFRLWFVFGQFLAFFYFIFFRSISCIFSHLVVINMEFLIPKGFIGRE